jgi:hypothetical protein
MVARIREILDGLCHFSARHERIDTDVSSYWYASGRVLIDPMRPSGGIDALPGEDGPTDILLTNRHHWRHSGEYVQAYAVTVHASRPGMHEFGEDQPVAPFDFGDELPGGAVAHDVGTISPDETALHLPGLAAVAFADGLVRIPPDAPLGFVPDELIGDDPEGVKEGLRERYRRLLDELELDHLLLAHGNPVVGDGREALERFVDGG